MTKTTADLIIRHAAHHLAEQEYLVSQTADMRHEAGVHWIVPTLFGLTGFIVIGAMLLVTQMFGATDATPAAVEATHAAAPAAASAWPVIFIVGMWLIAAFGYRKFQEAYAHPAAPTETAPEIHPTHEAVHAILAVTEQHLASESTFEKPQFIIRKVR